MTTETYDTKPKFDPNKPYEPIADGGKPKFDPNKPYEPVKKKEVSGNTSKTVSTVGTTAQKPVGDDLSELALQVTPEQIAQSQRLAQSPFHTNGENPNLDDDPIGNVTKPYKDKALTANNELRTLGSGNRNVSESTGQNKKVESGKANMQSTLATDTKKSFQELQDVTNHLSNSLFPNGKEAEIYLQRKSAEKGGTLPEDNQTVNIAKNKAAKYEYLKDILSKGSLDQMAVEVMRQNDPNLDKQISVLEQANGGARAGTHGYQTAQDIYQNIIPAVQQGRYIDEMLHDPDVKIIAQDDPKVKADFDKLSNGGVYELYPEYGEAVVKNRLSRAREQAGRNNMIANPIFNSSKYMDKLAEKEFADEPILLNIYNQKLKGNLEGKIDTPGVIDEFGTGAKHTYQQMGNTIADVVGLGKTEDERIYQQLENQYGNVNSGVTGWKKNVGTASNFLGMMASMGTAGAPLRATGLTGTAANAVITADTFYDSELNNWTMKYPGEPWKAQTGALASTALYAAGQKAFPSTKVADAIVGKMEPAIQDAVAKLNEGAVEKAVRDNLVKKFGNVLKQTVGGTAEATTHMVAISAFQNAMDHVLGLDDKTMSKYHPDNEIVDVAKNMIIGSAFPQFMMAYGNRNAVANSLYSIAENPIRFSEMLTRQAEENPNTKTQIDQKLQDIQFLSQTKRILDERNVTPDNQKRYLLEAMNEKYATDKAKNTADKTLSDQSKDSIKESQEIKEGILNGQNADEVMTTKKVEAEKEQVKAEANRNKLIEKGHTAIDKLLEEKDKDDKPVFKGIYRDIAKSDPLGFLEEISNKAQGVGKKGQPLSGGPRELEMIPKYGADIINIAKELFPAEKKPVVRITADQLEAAQPKENNIAEPIKSEDNAIPEQVPTQVDVRQPSGNGETLGSGNAESKIPPGEEVPTENKGTGQKEELRLTHADTEKIYNELGAAGRLETPTKHRDQLEKEANDKLAKGYDFDKIADETLNGDYKFDDADQLLFGKKVADLKAKQESLDINSPEFDKIQNQIERFARASDVAGTISARALQARKNYVPLEESISDYITREKEASGVETLTEEQKATAAKEFKDISETQKAYEEKIAALKNENARLRAEAEVKKASKEAKKGQKKDFKKEREDIFSSIQEKLKKAREESNVTIVPYAKELFAIAPDVAKLVRSYAEQGVTELAEMAKKIHEDLKTVIPAATLKDVNDLIAGEYNEKKSTRNELAATLRDLRDEAKLINKLEALENGEEPKDAKKKVESNRNITELRAKIKGLQKERAKVEKESTSEADKLKNLKSRTQKEIEKIEAQIKSGDFSKPEENAPLKLDKEAQDLQDKLIKLKLEREKRIAIEEYRKSSRWNKIQTGAANVMGVPRTLMASVDYSAPLRQALLPTVSHPMMAGKAAIEMFKSSLSQKNYDRWFFNLKNSDRFPLIKDSGLAITDVNNPKLAAKEEQFMNGLAEKIPLIGKMVKGSERAYTIYLNKMRVDLFNRFADQMQKDGRTFENSPEQYKQMASFVNNMTGRGDMGKTLNESAPVLNQLFFSPRLAASRLNTLTYWAQPRFWTKIPVEARKEYLRSIVSTAGLGLTILALAKANGAKTEDDPRSPDFGKITSGNTRWDMWGGHQQFIRLAAQVITGERKSSTSGKITEMGTKNPYSGSRGGQVMGFIRGKLAPVPSFVTDVLAGENAVGQKMTTNLNSAPGEMGIKENIANHLFPLIVTGLNDAIKDQGQKAWFTVGVPSIFGVGTNTYNNPEPKKSHNKKEKKHSK